MKYNFLDADDSQKDELEPKPETVNEHEEAAPAANPFFTSETDDSNTHSDYDDDSEYGDSDLESDNKKWLFVGLAVLALAAAVYFSLPFLTSPAAEEPTPQPIAETKKDSVIIKPIPQATLAAAGKRQAAIRGVTTLLGNKGVSQIDFTSNNFRVEFTGKSRAESATFLKEIRRNFTGVQVQQSAPRNAPTGGLVTVVTIADQGSARASFTKGNSEAEIRSQLQSSVARLKNSEFTTESSGNKRYLYLSGSGSATDVSAVLSALNNSLKNVGVHRITVSSAEQNAAFFLKMRLTLLPNE